MSGKQIRSKVDAVGAPAQSEAKKGKKSRSHRNNRDRKKKEKRDGSNAGALAQRIKDKVAIRNLPISGFTLSDFKEAVQRLESKYLKSTEGTGTTATAGGEKEEKDAPKAGQPGSLLKVEHFIEGRITRTKGSIPGVGFVSVFNRSLFLQILDVGKVLFDNGGVIDEKDKETTNTAAPVDSASEEGTQVQTVDLCKFLSEDAETTQVQFAAAPYQKCKYILLHTYINTRILIIQLYMHVYRYSYEPTHLHLHSFPRPS
jgi:hypothetical protein